MSTKSITNLIKSDNSLLEDQENDLNPTEEKTNLLAHSQIHEAEKTNGDMVLTPGRTGVYCFIDGTGGMRQVSSAVENVVKLTSHAQGVSHIASVGTPIGLLITGPLCMATAAAWTLPDAVKTLKAAKEELNTLELDELVDQNTQKVIQDAKNAIQLAELGVANQSFYFTMGASQTASGIVGVLSGEAPHLFHYAPVLTGHAASTASMASGAVLGAIYVARGSIMFAKAVKGYRMVDQFHKEFTENYEKGIEEAIGFMQETENLGKGYLERRVDPSCLEIKDEEGKVIWKYTATGKEIANQKIAYTEEEKVDYLKAVDKGIYTEKLKHRISMIIATAMIFGGILAIIAACVFTGGIALLVIGLASAIFFMSVEYIFLTYDSSSLFEKLRNRLYSEPEWLKSLEPVKAKINEVKNEEVLN